MQHVDGRVCGTGAVSLVSALSCLNPHVSPRVGIVPAFLAAIPAPHPNAKITLRGLGSTACSCSSETYVQLGNRPRPAFPLQSRRTDAFRSVGARKCCSELRACAA